MVSTTQSKKSTSTMNSLPDFGRVLGDGFRYFAKKWWLISLLFIAFILPISLVDFIPAFQSPFVVSFISLFTLV
ncbi:MAG: hypothetical protein ACOCQQ_01775, partial [Candidatus Nanoarchaeia archaeon]